MSYIRDVQGLGLALVFFEFSLSSVLIQFELILVYNLGFSY